MAAQQLVEQRAAGVPVDAGAHAGGDLEQLHAVTDLDVGDRAALGGQDDRDPGQGLLPVLPADGPGREHPGQLGERDGNGVYLTGSLFDAAATADAALEAGRTMLPRVNGLARMQSAAFRSVQLADRVSCPSAQTVNVYVSDTARATDDITVSIFGGAEITATVTVEADGEVRHADGTLVKQNRVVRAGDTLGNR